MMLLKDKLPTYYAMINVRDPLIAVIMSFFSVLVVLLIHFRKSSMIEITLLVFNLLVIGLTHQLDQFFKNHQDELIGSKLISVRYFD